MANSMPPVFTIPTELGLGRLKAFPRIQASQRRRRASGRGVKPGSLFEGLAG